MLSKIILIYFYIIIYLINKVIFYPYAIFLTYINLLAHKSVYSNNQL